MAQKLRVIARALERQRWAFLLIIGLLLVIHVFVFRGVLADAPEITKGNASLVREELVPFFDFSSQYIPAASSELTGSDEFRVTYAFWTSWVRYNPILPYMIVLLNTLSAFILFYAFYRIVRRFAENRPRRAMYVALLSALLIHFVLLYSKIAHFYTLIFGFSMFALSVTLLLEQLFFNTTISKKNIIATSALVLLNPAIHYHVIFYLIMVVAFAVKGVLWLGQRRKKVGLAAKKSVLYLVAIGFCSLIPYLLYIKLTTPATDSVFTQIPVNYWMIFYSSVPIEFLFSLDSLGHVDLFRYGNYLAPEARLMTMVVFLVIGSIFFHKRWRRLENTPRVFILALFSMLLIAMWMSIGYSSEAIYSFHQFLGDIGLFLAQHTNAFADAASQMLGIFINVLRFPHRFEFIVFYAVGVLGAIGFLWLFTYIREQGYRKFIAIGATVLIALLPFVSSSAYRETFFTGNFDGFLTPYKIPPDLTKIKAVLQGSQQNRVFIMPSMESGRQIAGRGTNYTFLDKFFIYYLDQPSLYYGGGADAANKIVAYMAYRAVAYDEPWWQEILVNDLGITHILVPKHLADREKSVTYLPDIDKKLDRSLQKSDTFKPVYEGQDYSLYKANRAKTADKSVMADLSWKAFLESFNKRPLTNQSLFFSAQMKDFAKQGGERQIMTDNPERTFYRLYTNKVGTSFLPSSSLLPFSKDLIASSSFTSNMFSLSTLYNQGDGYNYTHEVVPSLLGLKTAQFVGLAPHSQATIKVQAQASSDGTYRLVLYSASKSKTITIKNGGKNHILTRLEAETIPKDYIDFNYYIADVELKKGTQTFVVEPGEETLLTEYLGLIPTKDIPKDFNNVEQDGMSMKATDTPWMYNVTIPAR